MIVVGYIVFLLLIVYFVGMWFFFNLKCCFLCKMIVGFDYYLNFMKFGGGKNNIINNFFFI